MADAATCDPIAQAQARLDQAITHEAIAAAQYARAVTEAQQALADAHEGSRPVSIYLVTVLLAGALAALGLAALIGHALWARVLTIAAVVVAGAVLLFTVLVP